MQIMPLLLGILIGCVVSLGSGSIYSLRRKHQQNRHRKGDPAIEMRDDVLIGFLVLASFAMGVFLTYALLSIHL